MEGWYEGHLMKFIKKDELVEEWIGYGRYVFRERLINGAGLDGGFRRKKYTILEGQWQQNQLNGFGRFFGPTGNSYTGEFIDGKRNGKGKYIWSNGDWYEGKWKNNVFNGYGTFYFAESKEFCVGNDDAWFNGLLNKNRNNFDIVDSKGRQMYKQ